MISLNNVTFKWHKNDPIPTLNIPTLIINKGEHVFLHGPSGSGKSTLLALLAGINTATSGDVLILSQNLNTQSNTKRDTFRADHIGYIFQNFNLLPYLSPIENVTLGCEFSKSRQQKALKQQIEPKPSLQKEAVRLLNALGLNEQYHNKDVATLSIGQQQRVAAARAFIGSPELIIADEPTSALDANNRQNFIKLLFEQAKLSNSTLVFVSHDESLKPLFDRAIDLMSLQEPL
ncbi:ABC transporter ATP-binding protein [Pseudoalteromonas carrageenovora]|uniref:ABC transporter ATP-binding protein n=1 Tax=Pseudoalteromonas carrageenovora TaxID=227 RepID=UPI0026E40795|nr:ABC transporter ATP-binding protein [Pseudoalteromonas carrageenovora]MDO6466421.1 ABC transporter ATP-binding protein [Pseudoalteromonas carrageenovora]MDO6548979.1 ABC transporter ATP-binding protein [Pseudoalteromonas carrageenovora]MDO6833541.1 ABC transporter ATP-binding protein [Pseudoalteromonas carrageenovora]|tara:strand:+ start:1152 stop:1850 length:699 start_codon:yes stop_codon:yes gene_type:complete